MLQPHAAPRKNNYQSCPHLSPLDTLTSAYSFLANNKLSYLLNRTRQLAKLFSHHITYKEKVHLQISILFQAATIWINMRSTIRKNVEYIPSFYPRRKILAKIFQGPPAFLSIETFASFTWRFARIKINVKHTLPKGFF